MNVKQKVCILIGIALFVLMGILPPWVYRVDMENNGAGLRIEASAGYSLLISPPVPRKRKDHVEAGFQWREWEWRSNFTTVSIDVTRLLIQWAMVVVLVGGLFVTLGERRIS